MADMSNSATQSENGRRPAQAQILSIADQQRWVSKTTRALGVSRDQNEGSAPSSIDCIRAMGSQLTYRSNMPTKKKKIRARDCNDEAANCGGLTRRLLKYVQRDKTIIGQFGELFAQLGVFCSLRQLQELIRLPQKEQL